MAILATVRGLAIAVTFLTTGSLVSSSFTTIPIITSLADHDAATAQILARQFDVSYRFEKITHLPAQVFSTLAFGYLAFQTRSMDSSSWKFYFAAAVSMFTVIPWTFFSMERDSQKIISLAQASIDHAEDTEPKLEHGGLAVPSNPRPSITPIEEFEPYEDSPFSGAEYEKLKVKKLLETWSRRNIFRVISTALAGALALSAVTTRVTLVTIVQGR